ncbi:MAG TPA: sodium:calcium antiporter [Alphaproteobacteria bacterium]|nr:sodium:calcium antiporter [Alphaproteobacteria bacterium]
MDITWVWIEFAVAATLIGAAGTALTRSADIIAAKTGMSRGWIGLILLAFVTSLPELVTGISSVTVADVPNVAVGSIFGSCVFNLVLLSVLDFLHRSESVYRRAAQGHILSAGFGVVLIGFAGMNLLLQRDGLNFHIGHVGLYTPVIMVLYLVAIRSVFVYEHRAVAEQERELEDRYKKASLRNAILIYTAGAAVVTMAGAWLPFIANDISTAMGWHKTFVGTLFVAGVTSLPEAVVTIVALRIGSIDMAIANLLGSNLFDIGILAIDDLFFFKGPILGHVSPAHAVSAFSAVVMSGIVIIGIIYRPTARLMKAVGWISLGLFMIYLLNTYVLYLSGD